MGCDESAPMVVLTGVGDLRRDAVQAGAVSCLMKPLNVQNVEALVSFLHMRG